MNNRNKHRIKTFLSRYGEDYMFMAPFLLVFCAFTVVPVLISMILSLTQFDVLQPPIFSGISNYIRLLMDDSLFPIALKNTLFISLLTGPISFFLSLLLAWLLNELGNKMRSFMTLLFYAPAISGGAYMIWQIIYSYIWP